MSSAPSSDPPQDPPQQPSGSQPKDSSSISNDNVESNETQPLLSDTDAATTGEDVAMEDTTPKIETKEDDFEDVPEGVMSVSSDR